MIASFRFNILKIFLLALWCPIIFDGCSAAKIFHTRRIHFITAQDSVQLNILPQSINPDKVTVHTIMAMEPKKVVTIHKSVYDTLDSEVRYYIIEQAKKGYLPMTTPFMRTRFNGVKIIDLAIPPAIFGMLISQNLDKNGNIMAFIVLYYTTLGWIGIAHGPWTTYKHTFLLPALVPMKYKNSTENDIYIKDITFKDSLSTSHEYSSMNTYKKGILKAVQKNKSIVENISGEDITDHLNSMLRECGYIDTTNLFSRLYSGSYIIKCSIQSTTAIHVHQFNCCAITSLWKIYNAEGNRELYQTLTTDTSKWLASYSESTLMSDALRRGLTKLLKEPDIITILKQKTPTTTVIDTVWKPITLLINPGDTVHDLNDASQAVVTIKMKDNYFSGCIISSDGYVITTRHLSDGGSPADSVRMFLPSGDSVTASHIRSNSLYDFALYKITKPGHYKCFLPDTSSNNIKMGEEVYSLSTPEDISLKQSLSKGIVSGKRIIKDKYIIQTDVSINNGSSGGALVDKNGHLLGIINSRIIGIDVQGIGFAVPSYYIRNALKLSNN